MAKELVFTETFKKNYGDLPPSLQNRFDRKLELFLQDPKHPSLNIHRYHGREDVWEGYVNKAYRFTFFITQIAITFRNIGPHAMIDKGKV